MHGYARRYGCIPLLRVLFIDGFVGSARALFSGQGIKLTFPKPLDLLLVAAMIVVPIFCVFAFSALQQVMEAYDIVEKLYREVKDKNRSDLSDIETRVVNLIGGIERERLERLEKKASGP